MHLSAADLKRRFAELRDLVTEWDPLGLIEAGAPFDEYDCVVGPLLRRLEAGASVTSLAGYLDKEIRDHFGTPAEGIEAFAIRATQWYSTHWPGTDATPMGDTR
jgi:hypothetical protein